MSNIPYSTGCFPLHLAVLSCGENFHPLGYWTVVGKEPFRFLISEGLGNHTLKLLRAHQEAALHFFPWSAREWVVRAGYISGRDVNKAGRLNVRLTAGEQLQATKLIEGFENAYECRVLTELKGISSDHAQFVLEVIAAHENVTAEKRDPILFFSQQSFINLRGERWTFRR
ncbi:MAG: flavin reductase [Chloroflexota bacterium]|jgi:flavin reductase (DIM6/NTAB) family NADH-FMN oxidoreductase RutF